MGWLAYFIDEVVYGLSSLNHCMDTLDNMACGKVLAVHFLLFFENGYLNMAFWILVVFIILSLIRYLKYRKADDAQVSATNQRPYQR